METSQFHSASIIAAMRNAMEWLRLALLTAAAGVIAYKTTPSVVDAVVMLALLSPLIAFNR
jgi:Mg/Co/Ni transporter MgtE